MIQRTIALLLLLTLCISSCKKKQEDILADIRKNYGKIDNDIKSYTKRSVDDITSPDGGNITGFYKDEDIRKIYTQHFGEQSRSFTDYYFDGGMLSYVVRQEFVYNKPNTYTEEKARAANDSIWYDDRKTKLEVNYYYFHDNKLIKWIGPGGKDIAVNIPDFTEKEPIILAEALIALKQLKEQ